MQISHSLQLSRHNQNNGKFWTSKKPGKLYITQKHSLNAIQKYDFY